MLVRGYPSAQTNLEPSIACYEYCACGEILILNLRIASQEFYHYATGGGNNKPHA